MADAQRRKRKRRDEGASAGQDPQLAPLTPITRIEEADIQAVADLYFQIMSLGATPTGAASADISARFHEYIHTEMESAVQRMREVADPFLRAAQAIGVKARFYANACEDELSNYAARRLGKPELSSALSNLFEVHHGLLGQFQTVTETMGTYYKGQLADVRARLAASEKEAAALLEAAERMKRAKSPGGDELERLRQENAALRARLDGKGAAQGGSKAASPPKKKASAASPAKAKSGGGGGGGGRGPSGLAVAADSDDSESDAGSDDVQPLSMGGMGGGGRGSRPSTAPARGAAKPASHGDTSKPLPITLSESFQRLTQPKKTAAQRAAEAEAAKRKDRKKPAAFRPDLKLKNLHALIEEIYHSKWKYNKVSEQSQLPHETMEEHVFTFLNHKYGLKPIIEGWLDAIKRALARYFNDPDVKCFAYILNNRLHEDYIFSYHYAIKRSANQLLLSMLKIENPKVPDAELTELFQERLNDHLTQAEWIFLIQQIYQAAQDQTRITALVSAHISEGHRKAKEAAKSKAAADFSLAPYSSLRRDDGEAEKKLNIPYRAFVKIVLDYQLDGYARFLGDFAELFREVWTRGKQNDDYIFADVMSRWQSAADANPALAEEAPVRIEKVKGVLSEVEFADLTRALDPAASDSHITSYLAEADPFETGRITFSRAVAVLMDVLKSVAMSKDLAEDGAPPGTINGYGGSDAGSELSFGNEMVTH